MKADFPKPQMLVWRFNSFWSIGLQLSPTSWFVFGCVCAFYLVDLCGFSFLEFFFFQLTILWIYYCPFVLSLGMFMNARLNGALSCQYSNIDIIYWIFVYFVGGGNRWRDIWFRPPISSWRTLKLLFCFCLALPPNCHWALPFSFLL